MYQNAVRIKFLTSMLLLCALVAGADCAYALDFDYNLRSMLSMNPDFSTYPSSNGIVWRRRVQYALPLNGGMERRTQWIILGRSGLSAEWLNWDIPMPEGGEAEVLEAAAYNMSAEKILDAVPADSTQGGTTSRSLSFGDLPDQYILVVTFREFFPARLSIDDLIWLGCDLPVWETDVEAAVPSISPFFIDSNAELEHNSVQNGDLTVHSWKSVNLGAILQRPLFMNKRAYLVFGMRDGEDQALRCMNSSVNVPSMAEAGFAPDKKNSEAVDVLRWIYRQPSAGQLSSLRRAIPRKAPWTNAEKVLTAYSWLKGKMGDDVRLGWLLPYKPAAGKAVCEEMFIAPVLGVRSSRSKTAFCYYDMCTEPQLNENSPFLQGETIYVLTKDGEIDTVKISGRSAADNRMNVTYRLALDREAVLSGKITVVFQHAWRDRVMSFGNTEDSLKNMVNSLFAQSVRYTDLRLENKSDACELTISLADTQTIKDTNGRNVLVSIPPLVPSWFKTLSEGPFPAELGFPFSLEAKVSIALPAGVENVILPVQQTAAGEKIKYSDSYKLVKKKTIAGEAHMTVAAHEINENNASALMNSLQRWHVFMTKNLPIQLKVKK